ncbi:MAG: hypothetical protein BWY12_02668 [candidate division BRC1 bacterium ADurb.Bin183]|nr:MAG: hypothetical protein BWY12_02668 [candidate division BRC1 bacterium ADurb.Bin183]
MCGNHSIKGCHAPSFKIGDDNLFAHIARDAASAIYEHVGAVGKFDIGAVSLPHIKKNNLHVRSAALQNRKPDKQGNKHGKSDYEPRFPSRQPALFFQHPVPPEEEKIIERDEKPRKRFQMNGGAGNIGKEMDYFPQEI